MAIHKSRLQCFQNKYNNLFYNIFQELDAEKFEYSPGILSSLLSLYIQIQDESRATDTFRQIEEYPKFFLDEHKMIDFCKLKVQTGSSLGKMRQLWNRMNY